VPTLIAHDIQPGGYYDAPQNDRTVVTLPSTDGADFLIAFYTANSIQGNLNPVFDSEGNVWTKIESAPPGDFDHDYNIASMGIYWCANPITSPTSQTFTVINLGGSLGTAHACLAVQAWGGLLDIAYDTQLWSGQQLSPYTQGPLPIEGIAFAAIGLGYDETHCCLRDAGRGWIYARGQFGVAVGCVRLLRDGLWVQISSHIRPYQRRMDVDTWDWSRWGCSPWIHVHGSPATYDTVRLHRTTPWRGHSGTLIMASTKISNLPAVSAAAPAQEFPVADSGTTRKVTITQLLTLIGSTFPVILSDPVSPADNTAWILNDGVKVALRVKLTGLAVFSIVERTL
jgi:hypothetical protein